MANPTIYLMPFSHLDLFWLGEREECLSRGNRVIDATLDILRRAPEFRFLLEDMVFVDHYLGCHPERADELCAHVRAGRIEVGPKWSGIFQNLQTGEDLVRNLLYGKQFVREHFGVDAVTVHLGDLPGYTPQYPQIAAKGGVKNVVITRGGPSDQVLYHWQAPDGSRVLAWNSIQGYAWARQAKLHVSVDEAQSSGLDRQAREIMALTSAPIMMHWGVDLIVPPMSLVENVASWNERTGLPMCFSTPTDYFAAVEELPGIPVLQGEIPSLWPYTEPSIVHVAGMNTPASHALMAGENWSELARRLGLGGLPPERIAETWRKALEGMDHNYRGTGAPESLRRKREYLLEAVMVGEQATRRATQQIAENIRLPSVAGIVPVVVFNGTSWTRTEMVSAHASFYGEVEAFLRPGAAFGDPYEEITLYDADGLEVPFQYLQRNTAVTREASLCFTARDVPSHGYALYYLVPAGAGAPPEPCCQIHGESGADALVVESCRFRLEVSRPSGGVTLVDKVLGRVLAAEMNLLAEEERIDQNWFQDETTGRTFHNLVQNVEVVENGPVRARVIVEGLLGTMLTRQEWVLGRDVDYVEVTDTLTWQGASPHVRAQRAIPTGIPDPRAVYGVPFGANAWNNLQPNTESKRGDEISARSWRRMRQVGNWIDLQGAEHGLTVASTARVVGLEGGLLSIHLLRTGGAYDIYADVPYGSNRFVTRTRIQGHVGDWRTGRAYRAGLAVNVPLRCVSVHDPLGPKRLPPVASLCQAPADNVIVTTIKPAEAGDGTIVRGYEVEGQQTEGTLELVGETSIVTEVDLMEEHPRTIETVLWRPYEIKTIKLI